MLLSNKQEIKRLVVYFFYDKDGIVDDYIPYMLNDLNKSISELLVVCNGKLTSESREKLEKYTYLVEVECYDYESSHPTKESATSTKEVNARGVFFTS